MVIYLKYYIMFFFGRIKYVILLMRRFSHETYILFVRIHLSHSCYNDFVFQRLDSLTLPVVAFVIIPLLEFALTGTTYNADEKEKEGKCNVI